MTPKEYAKLVYQTPHFEEISDEDQAKEYTNVVKRANDAIEYWRSTDRPLEVLAIHGSGRDTKDSCAQHQSNSAQLLQYGLGALDKEKGINVVELPLRSREYNKIEPCNNCVSTTSRLCGFPCDCFPLMEEPAQMIYPQMLRADVILISSGVKQASMDSRLKLLIDRCISLDGGYSRPEGLKPKDMKFRDEQIKLSRERVDYVPRLWGRVGAYFITSKDHTNPFYQGAGVDYIGMVAKSLKIGNDSYGIFHPSPSYVGWAGRWNEDYSYDPERLERSEKGKEASRALVLSAVGMAKKFRAEGYPKFEITRVNRT